ncbi:MAG: YitT family protein [Clostridia bacterium]|nr:YitT family protein [Clostridia bacterium]
MPRSVQEEIKAKRYTSVTKQNLWQKQNFINTLKEFILITLGAAIVASTIFLFMLPSKVAIGSASALAMVLASFIPLPISVINLFINVFLLVVGFILIGPEFGAKTVYTSIIIPVFIGIWEFAFPNFQSLTQDPVLDVLCHLLIVSLGMAILFSRNASSGGLDIVAKILNKYLKLELGKAGALAGTVVALSSYFCNYDTKLVILSVLGTYFGGIIVDNFIFNLNIKRRVCIISSKLDEIIDYILHNLHSGATLYNAIGAYNNTPEREVVTIVDKHEYRKLMEFVRKTDPKAFVTVYSVNEIRYQPKIWG